MDPVSTVQVDEDTSFAIMLEAERRGHRVDHCTAQDLFLEAGVAGARGFGTRARGPFQDSRGYWM